MGEEEQMIKISVRNLVEFILREGDIDNRRASSFDKDAMLLGGKIHRKIQRQMGSDYRAEVSLKLKVPCDDFFIQIEGRADGIQENDMGVMIDEIKSILKSLDHMEEPVGVHLAQAKCYAYIYAKEHGLSQIAVQMTYCQMETEEIKRFRQEFTFGELEQWFQHLIEEYKKWARYQMEWKRIRNQSIKSTEFPFDYRNGQKELVTSVYRTILRKKKLFIQAPTGVGKTMATIFPAVKAVGESIGDKIFYLTAKTITRTVAEQAFLTLKAQKMRMKVITLTAKDKMCFCEERLCNPEDCPFAKGHYDRINDAVYNLIMNRDDIGRETLEEQARNYQVCPFELGLDVSLWVDAVICDYNYVFDPNAHLKRFFGEGSKEDYLFLIDEAHNLVERGREIYSATLYKEDLLAAKKAVKIRSPNLAKRLEECNKQFLALKRECETYQVLENVSHIVLKLMNIVTEIEKFLEECEDGELRQQILELFFSIRMFLYIYDRLDDNYVIYSELEPAGRFKVKLFCVNPAANLEEYLGYGRGTIFFSATLLPIVYYKKLLSTNPEDYAVYAESAFPTENRCLLLGNDVSTKYTLRGPEMYQKYARYLLNIVCQRRGNYLVFFPSYRFLEDVREAFEVLANDLDSEDEIETVVQSSYMNEEAREIFLETFEEERKNSLLGFCVLGGVFSEGIDLVEDKLIGAMIVGTGLPQVCNDREILKNYFDAKGMPGFDYAYLYPGMNKVQQAAGRVIRTEEDKGIILLLDERFRQNQYQCVFPREWKQVEQVNLKNILRKLDEFWNADRYL
ncbi:MAG: ATP-dependent DNA helicase [Hespellia sp.]|nr:ATP-dependent DNA helicase [Hespellia sp.]